ncbi:MAG: glycoside hydrolase family 127 protein [Chromatiaceae bacterium]|nr:glycoside hydrolase family 127 protein [Chromatiaceae bacterium]
MLQYWPDCSIQWLALSGLTGLAGTEIRSSQHQDLDNRLWEIDDSLPHLRLCKVDTKLCELRFVCPTLCAERLVAYEVTRSDVETFVKWVYRLEVAPGAIMDAKINITLHCAGFLDATVTLHNPQAAVHPGGRWDLGDAHSLVLQGVGWDVIIDSPTSVNLALDTENRVMEDGDMLTQASSGGENWRSPVHVKAKGRVELPFKGYRWQHKGKLLTGDRASPVLRLSADDLSLNVTWRNFWQQFPNHLAYRDQPVNQAVNEPGNKNSVVSWRWHAPGETIELQPGEKLTKTFRLMAGQATRAPHDLPPHIAISDLIAANVIPFLTQPAQASPLESLTDVSLDKTLGFFAKREALDAYGWRNFGDLFADHESSLSHHKGIFVSHYNNQYDPVSGFLYRYLTTGDTRWWELARDLVDHIINIDIYDTNQDKPEYNGGLFWHTDHYLPALTSTHRSFSGQHDQGIYQGHAGGGGPGGQHCYTTGLALHYLLTASERSKQAVLQLTDWITRYYDGTDSLLELALALKNRHVPGLKNPFTGQYPLDRGTGNLINALLDAYWVTGNPAYLDQAGQVVRHSVHPADDISLRNLQDVEEAWFYTVLLQATIRLIWFKEQRDHYDADWGYAVNSLLHYADWMLLHEGIYLDKPDILEFPNQTWTAQDLRKACIFYAAARYHPTNRKALQEKAQVFEAEIHRRLKDHEETAFTRVQAILLQNLPMLAYYKDASTCTHPIPEIETAQSPFDHNRLTASNLLSAFVSRLRRFDWRKEQRWLFPRLPLRRFKPRRFKPRRFKQTASSNA